MKHTQQLFFELIRVALGTQEQLSVTPTDQEWDDIFKQSRKQTIVGVCFTGLEKLPAQQRPYSDLVVSWYAYNGKTEKKSRLLDERTDEVLTFFRSNGFQAVILKGQGIAQLYPNPLRRVSGDIDVWLEGGRKRIYDFARNYDKEGKLYGVIITISTFIYLKMQKWRCISSLPT